MVLKGNLELLDWLKTDDVAAVVWWRLEGSALVEMKAQKKRPNYSFAAEKHSDLLERMLYVEVVEIPSSSVETFPSPSAETFPSPSAETFPSPSDETFPSPPAETFPSPSDETLRLVGTSPLVVT